MEVSGEVIQRTVEGVVLLGTAAVAALKKKKLRTSSVEPSSVERIITTFTTEIKELYRVHAEQRRDELKPLEDQVQTVSGKVDLLVDRQAAIGQRIDKLETAGDETREIVVRLETAMGAHDQRAKDTRADINHRMDRLDDRIAKHIEANA